MSGTNIEGFYVAGVIIVTFLLLLFNYADPDMVFLGSLAFMLVSKVISVEDGVEGFGNVGLLTVVALFPVAAGISETGALDYLMSRLLGRPTNLLAAQLRLMVPVAVVSAFLNNTPVVLVLIPIVQTWARTCNFPPSQLFIPLSFASILGGTITLIGTSTNLVVAGQANERYDSGSGQCIRPDGSIAFTNVNCEEDGCLDPVTDCEDLKFTFEPFDNIDIKMFDLSRFGVPVAIAGIMYIVIFSPFLLPGHETLKKRKAIARGLKSDETSLVPKQNKRSPSPPKRISSTNSIGGINAATGFHDFIVGARVTPNSPAINKTVRDAGLRDLDDLFLVSVIRQGNLFSSDAVGPDFAIAEGDILEFAGLLDSLGVVCKEFSLQPITHDSHGHTASAADGNAHAKDAASGAMSPMHLHSDIDHDPARVLTLKRLEIPIGSILDGKTAAEVGFRAKYGAAILAIVRDGQRLEGHLGTARFQNGDVLLLDTKEGANVDDWYPDLIPIVNSEENDEDIAEESIRGFMVAMGLQSSSPLVGRSVVEAGLRGIPGLYLASIERDNGETLHAFDPESTLLNADDILYFVGESSSVANIRKIPGLVPHDDQVAKLSDKAQTRRLVEVVVAPNSSLVGKTVRESRFRSTYNAAIIGVHRAGHRVVSKIGDIEMMAGDVLLLDAGPTFVKNYRGDRTFALVAELENSTPPQFRKLWIAGLAAGVMVALASADVLNLLIGALLAAMIMIIAGCISSEQARKSISWDVYVTIAVAFGLSNALEESGVAKFIAEQLVSAADSTNTGDLGIFIAIYIATVVLSTIMANNAAAALMFPVAAGTAEEQGIKIEKILFLLMLAASASFASPFGYQTNLMVYGPGGYNFQDFLIFGGPMLVWQGIVSVAVIFYDDQWPVVWAIFFGGIVAFVIVRFLLESSWMKAGLRWMGFPQHQPETLIQPPSLRDLTVYSQELSLSNSKATHRTPTSKSTSTSASGSPLSPLGNGHVNGHANGNISRVNTNGNGAGFRYSARRSVSNSVKSTSPEHSAAL